MLEPVAIVTARSILFFIAMETAEKCSAAFPTTATTITPTKNSVMPSARRRLRDSLDQQLRHQRGQAVATSSRPSDEGKPSVGPALLLNHCVPRRA